jgi:uncharacterized protein with von Willebrand factor type A (vWA) domain
MIPAVARFVDALREAGVPVSPAEILDAARALDAVGLEDRARFRAALGATLAKGRAHRERFDRLFDRFFATPAREGAGRGEKPGGAGAGGTRSTGMGGRPARPRHREEPRPARTPSAEPARKGKGAEREERGERLRRAVQRLEEGDSRRQGKLRRVRVERDARPPVPGAVERDPARWDLTRPMTTDEERRLAREVPRIVQEIRLKTGRRLARAKRGRLWTRRLFRENLSRGGVPFVLPFRLARPRRPRVILLVDVSHSTARAAGYFLAMATEFVKVGREARVLAFVDRPVDATREVASWGKGRGPRSEEAERDRKGASGLGSAFRGRRRGEGIECGGRSFAALIESLPGLNLAALSDYGRALHALLHSHLRPGGRDTVLVVLGDARTNRFDPLPWALEEISRRTRALLWLVPEPRSRWGTGDSALADYLPYADAVVEARDLAGLARGVAELIRRL